MKTHEEMLNSIEQFIEQTGSMRQAAKRIGVSHAYLFDILKGNRRVSKKVAGYFGYKRISPPKPEPYFVALHGSEIADEISLP